MQQAEQVKLDPASGRPDYIGLAESMAGVGYWRYDLASRRIAWSDVIYEIYGVDRQSFDPNLDNALSYYHPEDRERVIQVMDEAIAAAKGYEHQLRLRRESGEIRDVVSKAACEIGPSGEVIALFGVFQDVTEHCRALRSARRAEARYKLLADNVGDVITRIRLDGTSNYISPAIEPLLGHRPEEMTGRSAQSFVHAEDRVLIMQAFAELAGETERKTVQHRAVHKDGRAIWVETHFQKMQSVDGQPPEIIAVIRDVTERRGMEAATLAAHEKAREQARRAQMAEQLARVGHWRLDLRTNAIEWSDVMYDFYGLPRGSAVELNAVMGMTHAEDQLAANGRVADARNGDASDSETVTRINRSDGELRILAGSSATEFAADGRPAAYFGTAMDVTEKTLSKDALEKSEARYRMLTESATDMVSLCSLHGRIKFITPASRRVLGYTPEELVGRRTQEFTHPDDLQVLNAAYAAYAAEGPNALPITTSFRARHKDGHWVWLEGMPRLIFDEVTGRPLEMQDVVRDVTERKALEAELIAAREKAEEAAHAKANFLANMSHELRTPLNSISGFSSLIAEAIELNPETRRRAKLVEGASASLVAIVNDILDYSKFEAEGVSLNLEATDISALLATAAELIRSEADRKGVHLSVQILSSASLRLVDPVRLRQIVLNLLSNAIKFTKRGGVTLSLTDTETGGLRIAVRDTGIGIPRDKLEHIFGRFAQADDSTSRKFGGSGLGLAISKKLLEAMGGQIGVESIVSAGSTFWITIDPAAAAPAVPALAPAKGQLSMLKGSRILLADDNPANRELFCALLADAGLDITQVEDGAQAVRAISEQAFDLVFMDIQMPVMDGVEAVRQIRASGRHDIPIIALTANVLQSQVVRYLDAGMTAHLPKPYTARSITAALEEHLKAAPEPLTRTKVANVDVLSELAAAIGRPQLLVFMGRLAEQLAELSLILNAKEPVLDELARSAHKVRGLAGSLGFTLVSETYEVLEGACETGEGLSDAIEAARQSTEDTLAEIAELRAA